MHIVSLNHSLFMKINHLLHLLCMILFVPPLCPSLGLLSLLLFNDVGVNKFYALDKFFQLSLFSILTKSSHGIFSHPRTKIKNLLTRHELLWSKHAFALLVLAMQFFWGNWTRLQHLLELMKWFFLSFLLCTTCASLKMWTFIFKWFWWQGLPWHAKGHSNYLSLMWNYVYIWDV